MFFELITQVVLVLVLEVYLGPFQRPMIEVFCERKDFIIHDVVRRVLPFCKILKT